MPDGDVPERLLFRPHWIPDPAPYPWEMVMRGLEAPVQREIAVIYLRTQIAIGEALNKGLAQVADRLSAVRSK